MQSFPSRDFALVQAAIEHATYFLELGADRQAAAYLQFAAKTLTGLATELVPERTVQKTD